MCFMKTHISSKTNKQIFLRLEFREKKRWIVEFVDEKRKKEILLQTKESVKKSPEKIQ